MIPLKPSPYPALRQSTLGQYYKNNGNQQEESQRSRLPPLEAPLSSFLQFQLQQQGKQYESQIQSDDGISKQAQPKEVINFDQFKSKYNPLSRITGGASGYINGSNSLLPLHPNDIGRRQIQADQFDMISGKKRENQSILSELVSQSKWTKKFERDITLQQDEDDDIVEVEPPGFSSKEKSYLDDIENEDDEDNKGNKQMRSLSMNKNQKQFSQKSENGNAFTPKFSQQEGFNFLPSNSQQVKSSQEIIDELKLKQFRDQSANERNKQEKQIIFEDDDDNIKINSFNRFQVDPANGISSRIDDFFHSYKFKTQKVATPALNLLEKNSNTIIKNLPQSQAINQVYAKTSKANLLVSQNKESHSHSQSNSDEENGEEGLKKKKLNDESELAMVKYHNQKLLEKQAKRDKIKAKEEEKKAKARQEFIEESNARRAQKLEEERKIQRQKLVHMKKMEELRKQRNEQQNTMEYRKMMKEQFKNMNLDEKLGEIQVENNTNGNPNKADKSGEGGEATKEKNEFEFMNPIGINRTLVDEYESEEERKNIFSLIHFIFSQNYNQEDIVRVENKRIPNKFSGWKEYFTIFEYLFLMECVSNIQQIYTQYKHNDNYSSPLSCYIRLISTKENSNGFLEFQVYRCEEKSSDNNPNANQFSNEAGEINSSEEDYYTISTLRNHAVLISNLDQPDLSILSQRDFSYKKGFLFFGWVVPPETNDSKSFLKIYADIDGNSFKSTFARNEEKIYAHVFNFQKLTTFLREYLSIKNMRYNGLNRFIYDPVHILETKTPVSNPQVFIPLFDELKKQYNQSQFQSIKEICLTSKGLCMLQGPPGTGKTHTLLGLLSGLFFYIKKNPETTKPKIMICAPSNTAVDEIVSRVIDTGLHLPSGKVFVNVIRIGAIDYVPSESVKRASLEYQIEKMMSAKGISSSDKVQKEMLIDLQISMVKLNQEIDKAKKEMQGQELRNQLDFLFDQKRSLRQKISQQKLEKVARRDQIKAISDQILGLADVVCCTLASSISEKLERFKNQIEVLIVDEAAQCTEPNNIIPLFYEPNKMVLIGDPKQLPATTFQPDSNITKYNRSLFERIIDNNIKPYFLDQQYRMHPNIREFPSSQFYEEKLKDGDLVLNRPFPDYLQQLEGNNVQFIDISFSKERINNKSYENECEAEASIHLCLQLIDEIEKAKKANPNKTGIPSIGIITPYKQQTKLINSMVRAQIPKIFHKYIQVNTVDSFQGQEKDIIIFTTVRANANAVFRENMIGFLQDERRMNVALTRARFCLVVLGHADTLNSNPIWGSFVDFMAKQKRYGKLKNKEELQEIGELLMKGKLIGGSSREYVKKDWGEQYQLAILRNQQVNELKLTDFEIESIPNNINLNPHVDSNIEEELIEFEGKEEINFENSDKKRENHENQMLFFKDRSAQKQNNIEEEISEINLINNRNVIIVEDLRKRDYNNLIDVEDRPRKTKGHKKNDVLIVDKWEEQNNFNYKRTGVTMKEAIENMQTEKIMNRKIAEGLSALLQRNSVKEYAAMQEEDSEDALRILEQSSNDMEQNSEKKKGLMKKIFAEKDKGKAIDLVQEIQVEEEKQKVITEDIYAKIQQQKIESLKTKKQQNKRRHDISISNSEEKKEKSSKEKDDYKTSSANSSSKSKEKTSIPKGSEEKGSDRHRNYNQEKNDVIIIHEKAMKQQNDKPIIVLQEKKKETSKNQFDLTFGLDRLMQKKDSEEKGKIFSLAELVSQNVQTPIKEKSKEKIEKSSNEKTCSIYDQISKQREIKPEKDSSSSKKSKSSKEKDQLKDMRDNHYSDCKDDNFDSAQADQRYYRRDNSDNSSNNRFQQKGLDSLIKRSDNHNNHHQKNNINYTNGSHQSNNHNSNDIGIKASAQYLLNNIYLKKN